MPSSGMRLDWQTSGCGLGGAHVVADGVVVLGGARQVGEHHGEELRWKGGYLVRAPCTGCANGVGITGSHATQVAMSQRLAAQ